MRKALDPFGREAATGEVFARHGPLGRAQLLLKPCGRGLVQLQELCSHPRLGSLFRRGELALGQRNAALLRHNPHRLGEADVLDLGHKAEHVARSLAAEAVVELAHRMNGERRRLFLVEGAEAGVVLRPRLAQADVALDHLDDVGLLLDGLGEVEHGLVCIEDKARGRSAMWKAGRVPNWPGLAGNP